SDPKQLPMNISNRRLNSIPDILVDPIQFKHLNFDSVRQPIVTGDGTAPYKSPGVAAGFHMSPFYVHDEIFVLLLRSDNAYRQTFADQNAIFMGPGFVFRIDIEPLDQRFLPYHIFSKQI